jgi:hypothetical protein
MKQKVGSLKKKNKINKLLANLTKMKRGKRPKLVKSEIKKGQ